MNGFGVFLAKELLGDPPHLADLGHPGPHHLLRDHRARSWPCSRPQLVAGAGRLTDPGIVIQLPDPDRPRRVRAVPQEPGPDRDDRAGHHGRGRGLGRTLLGHRDPGPHQAALARGVRPGQGGLAADPARRLDRARNHRHDRGDRGALRQPAGAATFVVAASIWLAFALFFAAVMMLCSVMVRSRGGAAGAGLFFLFSTADRVRVPDHREVDVRGPDLGASTEGARWAHRRRSCGRC